MCGKRGCHKRCATSLEAVLFGWVPVLYSRMDTPDQPSLASPKPSEILCFALAIVLGPLAWIIPARMSGHAEAWDGDWCWLWIAATAVASAVLGFLSPRRWWLWPLLLPASQ